MQFLAWHLMVSGIRSWTDPLTAVATGVLAVAAISGLVAANSRVRRAAAEIEARAFVHERGIGLSVRVGIRSVGFGSLRLGTGRRAPVVLVEELLVDDDGRRSDGEAWDRSVFKGEVIDLAETASAMLAFLLPEPVHELVG